MDYGWVSFYKELARKILEYKDNRDELIEKSLRVYKNVMGKLPNFGDNDKVEDIDPFTIFGFFNKRIKTENRLKIARGLAKELGVEADLSGNFYGIPVLNLLVSIFFRSKKSRREDDIDNFWSLFESAITYASTKNDENRQDFCLNFDKVIKQKGIRWNITMGLYWIAPDFYLNLDSRNQWYIQNISKFSVEERSKLEEIFTRSLDSGEEYLQIRDLVFSYIKTSAYKDPVSFSASAFENSQIVNNILEDFEESNRKNYKILIWLKAIIEVLRKNGPMTIELIKDNILSSYELTDFEKSELSDKLLADRSTDLLEIPLFILEDQGFIEKNQDLIKLSPKAESLNLTDNFVKNIFDNFDKESSAGFNSAGFNIETSEENQVSYWTISAGQGAYMWDSYYRKGIIGIGWDAMDNLSKYTSLDSIKKGLRQTYQTDNSYMNDGLALYEFSKVMKPGDIVYVKKGIHKVIGRGIISSDYIYDENGGDALKHIRKVAWTHRGQWETKESFSVKTLTNISPYPDLVEEVEKKILGKKEVQNIEVYGPEDFLKEVYMDEESYYRLVRVLKNKKNLIFQGPPGVGKTFMAKRLAYSMMKEKDKSRIAMVQFHQNYSYEDFIMGYRPDGSGFSLKTSVFYDFSKKAELDPDNDYFFIIDEINRGNLSKIFGELLMLIESDKRGTSLPLLYTDEKFQVPKNLYIIGTMNTADRSLAIIDYALRRRFAFYDMKPAFKSQGFNSYRTNISSEKFDRLIEEVERINSQIIKDESLGQGFAIGHSYFCGFDTIDDESLEMIVEFEILPLLKEYYFDDIDRYKDLELSLKESIK